MPTEKPRRLGRGLEALLAANSSASKTSEQSELQRIAISTIRPNPYQPRREFRVEELQELEASIRTSGLLQPITVRVTAAGDGFELVAGERRLRAAARLGWTEIPAIVRRFDDKTLLTLALVENLQRADLNPLEEAEGYRRLMQEFGLTQQQIAEAVGKERSTVANMLRLLKLPEIVRQMLNERHLTLGHARALLAIEQERLMTQVARETVARGLTVRDVEQRARDISAEAAPSQRRKPQAIPPKPPQLRQIEDTLRRHFQTDVTLASHDEDRGGITISFYSADDLERILELILGSQRSTM